jgi:type I restriction enzyme M protein
LKTTGDYPIFMAISRKVGQDSEGVPIYKRDATNNLTDEIDSDLKDIASAYDDFQNGELAVSGHVFQIQRSNLDAQLRINPQLFLPHLNETLEAIQSLDGQDGWTVTTLGELAQGIRLFKGPRFKSESIIVEEMKAGMEPYYTPSAILQEKSDSAKLIDVTRASAKQLATINAIRVKRGDIVITRSGSIGRVAYITTRYDDAIVSDDLIRARIPDENLRIFVLAFLETKYAQDQIMRNEYGAIQQHLEPDHVRNLLVPMHEDEKILKDVIATGTKAIETREKLEALNEATVSGLTNIIRKALT